MLQIAQLVSAQPATTTDRMPAEHIFLDRLQMAVFRGDGLSELLVTVS